MGDVIHNLPVVSDIHAQWPNAMIDWVVEEQFADIVRLHPAVHSVIPVAIRRWRKTLRQRNTWHEMRAFYRQLRNNTYDLVIDTQGLIKSALLTRLADGLRCGFCRRTAREPLASLAYHCTYAIPKPLHAVQRNRWLASAACEGRLDLRLNYGIFAPHVLPEWCPPQKYVVLLPSTSRDDKLWLTENWISLGQALHAFGYRVVLPGGNAIEQERAAFIARKIAEAIPAPPSSLTVLASVLQNATAVVGVDTGLTHLALALRRPTVAIYVATDPALTGVYAGEKGEQIDGGKTYIAHNLGGIGQLPTPTDVMNILNPFL